MAQTISGKANQFHFLGTYDYDDETMDYSSPTGVEDFIFDLEDSGICYVETEQQFFYDNDTGGFYLIKEVI